ncbi:MAG: MmgE/PrpD family protein [Lautropia sp.]
MTGLTESLAQFVSNEPFGSIDPDAAAIVRTGFIDNLATTIAGRDEPVVGIARAFVARRASPLAEATLLLGDARAASADAALVNATAGHALDFDDVSLGGHPSTVLVPAVLAEAERLDASGLDAMRAYLVGYEVWAELFSREPDSYHLKGWHPTAVLGTVGAAAAVAFLNRLPLAACRDAIALSASMACGLVANFGTMTKPLHAGRAAAAAIDAVHFAAAGLSASADAIEHHAGYLAAISPRGRVDRTSPAATLGTRLRILDTGLSIKKYPVCYATHRVVDGVLDLVTTNDIGPGAIDEVHASIGVAQASMLRNHAPVTGLEAKFSLEFAIASAIDARQVGLAQLNDAYVGTPTVRALMPKVRIDSVDTTCPLDPAFAFTDRVRIRTKDGRVLDSGEIRFARGHAKAPLRDDELEVKFLDCARGAGDLNGASLYAKLVSLDTLATVRGLFDARRR